MMAIYYPTLTAAANRYLNQLTFNIADYRTLYPCVRNCSYSKAKGFYRASATGHYFFNYRRLRPGLQMRVFAAKFGYLGEQNG